MNKWTIEEKVTSMFHIITEEELREYNAKQIEEIQKYNWNQKK